MPSSAAQSGSKSSLQPIKNPSEENHFGFRVINLLLGTIKIIIGLLFGLAFLGIFLVITITGIGPLVEYYQSKRDEKEALNHDVILQTHPEMFLLDIPGDVNKASGGISYRVMVRLTKPALDDTNNNASSGKF